MKHICDGCGKPATKVVSIIQGNLCGDCELDDNGCERFLLCDDCCKKLTVLDMIKTMKEKLGL